MIWPTVFKGFSLPGKELFHHSPFTSCFLWSSGPFGVPKRGMSKHAQSVPDPYPSSVTHRYFAPFHCIPKTLIRHCPRFHNQFPQFPRTYHYFQHKRPFSKVCRSVSLVKLPNDLEILEIVFKAYQRTLFLTERSNSCPNRRRGSAKDYVNVGLFFNYDPQTNGQMEILNQKIGTHTATTTGRTFLKFTYLPWAEYA